MQLATRQRGLEHIARIHRALGLARTDHGVQLVDEHNSLTFVFGQVFEHIFQTLFKLATEFGTRQQGSHIERQYAFALERIRHLARHDALRQTFDDGGLAHAGLADQHWVVFGPPLQHLDRAADFVITPDHRVQLARSSPLGQIHAILFQRLALLFSICAVDILAAAHGSNGRFQALTGQALCPRGVAQV